VTRLRRPSSQTAKVLAALAADPRAWRYGYELGAGIGLQSGSLYPILVRLSDRGLLESQWETGSPAGRPPRHLYRLNRQGLEYAAAHTPSERSRARVRRRPELGGAS
jgi:DNA-binding PadR family transcriptional regulator